MLRDRFVARHPRLLKEAPNSIETNGLRFLRFKVDQVLKLRDRAPNEMGRILQVSSVNSGEGRSFVSANLADLYAASGVQTCLLDLDFMKQNLIHYFPSSVTEGSPLMRNFPRECNFVMKRVHPHLFIVRTQPTNADRSEALETNTFESALSALRMKFDLIIVDTPPITGHMEAVVAAQYADALLMVIDQRATLRTEVENKIRVLQESLNLPIVGVMNFAFDDIFRAVRSLSIAKLKAIFSRTKGSGDPHEPRGGGSGGGGGGGSGTPNESKAPKFPKAPGTEVPYDMPLPPGVATGSAKVKMDITPAHVDDNETPLPPPIPGAEPPSRPKRDMFAQVEGRKPFGDETEREDDFKLDSMNGLVNAPDPDDLKDQPAAAKQGKKDKKDPKAG
jgi:Mrp family chromosome partitioning ATPase